MKRILVAGGAGFIGSHLCSRLIEAGHDVLCLDNFFTGDKRNIQHLRSHPRFELIRHDVVNPVLLEVDQVYNMACPASPVHYQHNPIKTVKTNVLGTMNLLGLCKRVKATLLQASTSEVYGDPAVHPQPEEYWGNVNTIGIRSCYDEGKRVAETLCMDYHRMNGVQVKIARIFNTYGPNMALNDGRVVSNFIIQALQGEPITMFGNGQQTRSFCFVDDLVEGLQRWMNHDPSYPGPINIGNPGEFTMLELAEQIIRLTGSKSRIEHKELPADDPRQRQPDISKAQKYLDWTPKIGLEEGLSRSIAYFKSRLEN